jgi:hypothetical protein
MPSSTDSPIDHTRDGYYQVNNPTVTVTPAPADQPGPPPSSREADQVGEPSFIGNTNPPGT